MEYGKTNILNKVFTKSTLNKWISHESASSYITAIRRFVDEPDNKDNRELISEIYLNMKLNYRNEYYYKNTLLNKLLLGIHSVNTTTALTEVNIAKSKADFILINGKAVVYEIKTELDNLDRLECQIIDYYKAFNHVAVLTYENNLENVKQIIKSLNYPVGLYVLRNNDRIGTIIKPEKYEKSLDFNEIYKILRKSEYEKLVMDFYGYLPNTTQFKYYSECKNLLSKLSLIDFYHAFTNILKKRCIIEQKDLDIIPYELKFLAYFNKMKREDFNQLGDFLSLKERGQ